MFREAECEYVPVFVRRVGDPGLVKRNDLIDEHQPQSKASVFLAVLTPEKMPEEKLLFMIANNFSCIDDVQA